MGAIVADNVVVEDRVIVGSGALVTPGTHLESGYLYIGSPARKARALKEGELAHFKQQALEYVELKNDYLEQNA